MAITRRRFRRKAPAGVLRRRRATTSRRMAARRPVRRRRVTNYSGNHYSLSRYVPYTAYSSTQVNPNTSVGSVSGDLLIYSFGYALAAAPIDTDGYSYSSNRFSFAADQVSNIAEYMNLFEQYRIKRVYLNIRYVGNGAEANTLGRGPSATSAQFLPTNPSCYLAYRKMHRDVAIPAASGTGWNNFHDASGLREYRFPSNKQIRINITPYLMQTTQTTMGSLAGASNLAPRRASWLTTGNATYTGATTVPHYGIDIMMRSENFVTNDVTTLQYIPHIFNITATYYFDFRYRKAGSVVI